MRRLRIPLPVQLPLAFTGEGVDPDQRWWTLPEETRRETLSLLARLIARNVLVDGEAEGRGDE